MDKEKKKQLLEEYKYRKPEMGVISFKCLTTGESFLGVSSDTRADFNSNLAKLNFGGHPNKQLLSLWQTYGQDNFEVNVIKVLKYKDPDEDHKGELEALREICLAEDSLSKKIWR